MTIYRILPWLASAADAFRPAAPWPAFVVALAAWLAGGSLATAQTRAASEPWIAQEDLPEPRSNQRARQSPRVVADGTVAERSDVSSGVPEWQQPGYSPKAPAPRSNYRVRQSPSVVTDGAVTEVLDVPSGVPGWQEPSYSPDGSVMEFSDLPLNPDSVLDPSCSDCGGACDGYPPVQGRPWLRFLRWRHPTCSRTTVNETLPEWQMPPLPDSPRYFGEGGWGGGGSGGLLQDRLWGRAEFLLFWGKGAEMPGLATTSPPGTAQGQAGVLGAPGTTLLFGDQAVNSNARAGGRFTLGWWFCPCQKTGFEVTYLTLATSVAGFHASDQTNPILAQPFINAQTGAQDASLVAYPGLETGRLDITLSNQFYMLGGLIRTALVREPKYRLDALFGFRHARLNENLNVASQSTSTAAAGAVPVGTVTNISDFFGASNQFYGADFGVATQSRRGRLSVDLLCKIALGYCQDSVLVQGSTATTLPSQAPSIASGGLLALPTNIGRHDLNGFGVLPELGVNFEYLITRRLSATFGYTVVYWSRVARPGDQVDLNLNPSQFPPGQLTGAAAPHFQSLTSDFWLQGITAGLKYQF